MQANASTDRDTTSNRSLQRSTSSKLRGLAEAHKIKNIQALVAALNEETDPIQAKALRDWLQRCIECFKELVRKSIEGLSAEDVQEYIAIGQLTIRSPTDEKLLQHWFKVLCNAVFHGMVGEEKIVAAMECALLSVDKSIFKDEPRLLLHLSNSLTRMLDPATTSFAKATYNEHRATLSALHQTFVVLQQIAPRLLNPKSESGIYQAFKKRLEDILKYQIFYPFAYQVQLVLQSIQKLENEEDMPTLMGALNRLFHGTWGALCIVEGIRGLAAFEFRPNSFLEGCNCFQECFRSTRIERKPWYDWIQALNQVALQTFRSPEKYEEYEECFNLLKDKQGTLNKREDRMAIRFGLIDQLVMLVLQSSDKQIITKCCEQLLDLAERLEVTGWADDVEIFEALMEALVAVREAVEDKEPLTSALEMMQSFPKPAMKQAFDDWLEGSTLENKMASKPKMEDGSSPERPSNTQKNSRLSTMCPNSLK